MTAEIHNIISSLEIFGGLFILLLISIIAGRVVGIWQHKNDPHSKINVISVTEGAVFGLLGLLIAFTFSSAYERFELRKVKIIEESNAIERVNEYLELLPPTENAKLHNDLINYLNSRIAFYKKYPDINSDNELQISKQLRKKLWDNAVLTSHALNNHSITLLLLPAIDNMFELAEGRFFMNRVHPSIGVFVLLFGLAILGSFLAGYSTAGKRGWNLIYILTYSIITAFTIYVIIDLEFPRSGLIRVNEFDDLLILKKNELVNESKNVPEQTNIH